MVYEVVVPRGAEQDIDEAVLWYEEQQKGLGIRFYSIAMEKLEKLKTTPQYFSYIHLEYRRIPVNPFPFNIIYKIMGSVVLVLAVLHHSKNSDKLKKRIK